MDSGSALAAIHRRFARADAELANGFAEHVTMGAEAMLTLGVDPAVVLAWAGRHDPVPTTAGSPLDVSRDQIARELAAEDDWTSVLRHHVRSLVGQLDAHLFHGLIRTAHATRALHDHDGPDARAELAAGLAAWTVWASGRHDAAPSPAADPRLEIVDAARRGAGAFVTTPSIFTLHAVTAPMAYLLVADHLDEDTHAIAAAVFARTHERYAAHIPGDSRAVAPTTDELAGLAQRWDAHPAKLVEASLRGYAHEGDQVFLDAAAAVLR